MATNSTHFKRIYVEITNVCNLACSFCPKTSRAPRFMTADEFSTIARKIKPYTDYVYLHVMGEPLLNPDFTKILTIAGENGLAVNLTTNGTLLSKDMISHPAIRKISISLHSFEGNDGGDIIPYLERVYNVCKDFTGIVSYRLWNEGGKDARNDEIVEFLSEKTGVDINSIEEKNGNRKILDNVYLENARKFEWPSLDAGAKVVKYCHALSQQIAILCDGTVVPCCLDSEGKIKLGNIFEQELSEILDSDRVRRFKDGIINHKPSEELCRHCGYAERFTK